MKELTYHTIYKKLEKIIPDLAKHIEQNKRHGKSQLNSPGMMDLNFDYVGKDERGHIIALSHYFKQGGDLVADPDMQILVIPEKEMAEALSFQNQFLYQEVYEKENGVTYVRPKLKRDLNSFLNQWLTNAINQGHHIDLSKGTQQSREDEIDELRNGKEGEDRELER